MPAASPRRSSTDRTRRSAKIVGMLAQFYPNPHCALEHHSALELLIATILSAQCTDVRVNQVTPTLFRKYRSAADYADADPTTLEDEIRSTGFFRNKAKSIRECCRMLVERHRGQVPNRMEDLVQLAGIGRKTANVVLGTAMGIASGVVVDTHVTRLSRRMGMTRQTTPEKIEQDLMRVVPRDDWIAFSHRMIEHGRQVCMARKPDCEACKLADCCPKVGVRKS